MTSRRICAALVVLALSFAGARAAQAGNDDIAVLATVQQTMQDDYPVANMTDILPMNRVLWANDYPHGDGIWPNSRTVLAKMAQGGAIARIKVSATKAGKFKYAVEAA